MKKVGICLFILSGLLTLSCSAEKFSVGPGTDLQATGINGGSPTTNGDVTITGGSIPVGSGAACGSSMIPSGVTNVAIACASSTSNGNGSANSTASAGDGGTNANVNATGDASGTAQGITIGATGTTTLASAAEPLLFHALREEIILLPPGTYLGAADCQGEIPIIYPHQDSAVCSSGKIWVSCAELGSSNSNLAVCE